VSAAPPPLRVVIVDDTAEQRDLLRRGLEDDGFDVVAEAGDGREGIAVARSAHPDVILLDLAMPVMDGLEALPTLRTDCPDATIVVLSGFGTAQSTRRALAAGADGYLRKGIPVATMLAHLRDLTEAPARTPSRAVAGSAQAPSEPFTTPGLPESARAAPYGLVELVDEPVYRVIGANHTAVEILGRACPVGVPLFSLTPSLASSVTLHRAETEASFEVELGKHRVSAVLCRPGDGAVQLFLVPADHPEHARLLADLPRPLR
jgi:CheY-like chemotaxis protein